MSRRRKIAIAILVLLVAAGAVYLPGLYRRVVGLRHIPASEEAGRRAAVEPPLSTSTDQPTKARMFWASATVPGNVAETDVDTKLSADPVERRQPLLTSLIAGTPHTFKRPLPPMEDPDRRAGGENAGRAHRPDRLLHALRAGARAARDRHGSRAGTLTAPFSTGKLKRC